MKIEITLGCLSEQMPYKTVGWWGDKYDGIEIKVADCGDRRTELLVALHELVEVFLCREAGVTTEQVDAYDTAHEQDDEPGANRDAPYYSQHAAAMAIETAMAAFLGVDWKEHNDRVDAAWERIPSK